MTIRRERESGRLANLDAVLEAHESVIASGGAAGTRAIDLRVWDGISVRVYPDRGLDLGQAWYRGVPLAWVSQVGEAAPLEELEGMAWGSAFGGGLMVTCGLRSVGMPSEGHGLHGTYSHLAASAVTVEPVVDEAEAFLMVKAVVDDPAPPLPLRVERTIRTYARSGRLEVEDITTNLGNEPAEAPLLYHFNFGYPLWAEPASLEMPVVSTTARDPQSEVALDSWHLPPPVEAGPERVLEHEVGEGWAQIRNEALGLALTLRWDTAALPRLNQWLDPNPGMSVLGIEPANCTTRGRAHDREHGVLPFLGASASRTTRLTVVVHGAAD